MIMQIPTLPTLDEVMAHYRRYEDPEKPVLVRDTSRDRVSDHVRDYAVYECPVREQMCLALVDEDGRYWVDHSWVPGGSISWFRLTDGGGASTGSTPIPLGLTHNPAGASVVLARAVVEALPEGSGSYLGVNVGRVALGGEAPLDGDDVDTWTKCCMLGCGWTSEKKVEARAWAVWVFDYEWGVGSFLRAAKSARARHVARLRMNRYKHNAKYGVKA